MLKTLKNSYSLFFFLFCLLTVLPQASYAQDEDLSQSAPVEEELAPSSEEEAVETVPEPGPMKAGPKLRELEAYTNNLLRGLEPYQAQYIYQIRQEFGVIRSVQVIRNDIERAVESCGTENPEVKEDLETRFNDWKDAILPKLAVADVALKDAIHRQSFRPTVRVTMLLDHVQEAFEEREANVKKVPVTTLEACQSLLESLDKTEENLQKLLDETTHALNKLSIDPEETASLQETEAP